ncbi:hypothetical protein NLG97_g8051 [Lecanicillium saksenae]|uniref:Uncharacterized protein n=1 Tax=Lecanicillium saksenae TaxID=468837 RepID=A0ACC1QLR4_9HYPO|nr:hypothetical protein NLG97_g8051 [Lecanicillium saksenae]
MAFSLFISRDSGLSGTYYSCPNGNDAEPPGLVHAELLPRLLGQVTPVQEPTTHAAFSQIMTNASQSIVVLLLFLIVSHRFAQCTTGTPGMHSHGVEKVVILDRNKVTCAHIKLTLKLAFYATARRHRSFSNTLDGLASRDTLAAHGQRVLEEFARHSQRDKCFPLFSEFIKGLSVCIRFVPSFISLAWAINSTRNFDISWALRETKPEERHRSVDMCGSRYRAKVDIYPPTPDHNNVLFSILCPLCAYYRFFIYNSCFGKDTTKMTGNKYFLWNERFLRHQHPRGPLTLGILLRKVETPRFALNKEKLVSVPDERIDKCIFRGSLFDTSKQKIAHFDASGGVDPIFAHLRAGLVDAATDTVQATLQVTSFDPSPQYVRDALLKCDTTADEIKRMTWRNSPQVYFMVTDLVVTHGTGGEAVTERHHEIVAGANLQLSSPMGSDDLPVPLVSAGAAFGRGKRDERRLELEDGLVLAFGVYKITVSHKFKITMDVHCNGAMMGIGEGGGEEEVQFDVKLERFYVGEIAA